MTALSQPFSLESRLNDRVAIGAKKRRHDLEKKNTIDLIDLAAIVNKKRLRL
jgi:hypothetical protein